MQEMLKQHCLDRDRAGLLLLSLPTGFGKTHNVLDFIYENYLEFAQQQRKIFFITNLKKNLPYEDLKERFKNGDEKDYEKYVIFINSNSDSVINNLSSVDPRIPDRFKTSSYRNLMRHIELLGAGPKKLDRDIKDSIKEKIRTELEPNFRKYFTDQLKKQFPTKAERLNAVKADLEFQWIGALYPAVFTDEKTILFLSMDKFIRENTTIIEDSYKFHEKLTDGSLIFIDEFDATKESILKSIIDSGQDSRIDLLKLFLNIHNHLMESELPQAILHESKSREHMIIEKGWLPIHKKVTNFQEKAHRIFTNYKLQYSCKSTGDISSNKRNFLFYDFQFHNVLDAQHDRIWIVQDHKNRTNWITTFREGKNESGTDIRALLRDVDGFLKYFQRGIGFLAENYCQLKKEDKTIQEAFPMNSAVKTVLNSFHLDHDTVNFLSNQIMKHSASYRLSNDNCALQRQEFYDSGFSYYDIVDSDEHDTLSKIYLNTYTRTPESFMADICSQAMVVGMSATAGLQANLGNYDLRYLYSRLGTSFIRPSTDDKQRMREHFHVASEGYDNISIKPYFIETGDLDEDLGALATLLDDREAATALWNEVRSRNDGSEKHIFSRYIRALTALDHFLKNLEIHAFLCFFNKLPKRSDPGFDLDTILKYAKMIQSRYPSLEDGAASDTIVVLSGNDFDETKLGIKEALSSGKRRFILSAYQTIGAGQNLQYPIPGALNPVQINGFPACRDIDIDAIYLDRPTNLLVNINSDDFGDNLTKYIFQLEFMLEDGAISPSNFEHKLREAFSRANGRSGRWRRTEDVVDPYQTEAYARNVSRIVVQAVGRICRTNMKAPTIHVLADSYLKRPLTLSSLPDDMFPVREYSTLIESIQTTHHEPDPHEGFRNRASGHSNRSAANIQKFLRVPWDERRVKRWQDLREQTLRQPWISSIDDLDSNWSSIYIELPSPARSYRYRQMDDYRFVEVSFSADEYAQEVSERAARLNELMAIKHLRDLFELNGWATGFGEAKLMIDPPIFNNIYKGALGEVCGRHILQEHLGIQLTELDVPEYEKFDYKSENNIYFDFKLWNDNVAVPAHDMISKIQEKRRGCEADRVFIINILGESGKQFRPIVNQDGTIVEIPFICQDNSLSVKALSFILEEISNEY